MNNYSDERTRRVIDGAHRSPWTSGPVTSGGLPRAIERDSLPTAGVEYANAIVAIPGDGATTADVAYMCLRNSSGVWGWRVMATG